MARNNLPLLRTAAGMTRAEVAKLLSADLYRVALYEEGEREIPDADLERLARVFRCSPRFVAGRFLEGPA